jgi:secondary thiamine-phosphate synthase enzyme
MISITSDLSRLVREMGLINGVLHVFVLHTTCGLTINENADPDVVHDLLHRLDSLAPWKHSKDRHMEGNSAAHLKSSLLGSSVAIPVLNGNLLLGTWQGVFFAEFDGPRTRSVHCSAISKS